MISLRRQHIVVTLLSGMAFVLLLNLVFLHYSIGDRPWLFYSSDSIYLPYLYQDLIMRDGKLSEWIFSSTPYFFPDTLIYFILAAIFHNLRLAILLYAIVQFSLYYWLIIAIGKKILKNQTDISLLHLGVLLSIFFLSKGYLQQETLMMGLISQSHFGTALMYLLGLLLILNTFSSESKWNYLFLFIVCFLTVFSDILYLTQFFAPAIMSLCLMIYLSNNNKIKKICAKNIVVISLSCIASYGIYRSKLLSIHVDSYTTHVKRIHLAELINAAKKIIHNLSVFYQYNAVALAFWIIFIVLTLHCLTKAFFQKNKYYTEQHNSFIFTVTFLFASIITGILSLLFFDNNLMATNFISLRHCIPFLIFPIFLGVPLFFAVYTHLGKFASTYYIYIIILIIGCAYFFTPKGSITNIINFYPKNIACLDAYVDKYHLKNGFSYFFWESRSSNFLSKKNLNIVNINFDLSAGPTPRLYFTTLHDFKNKDFNFILFGSSHLVDTNPYIASNITQFKKKFGTPSFEFRCPSWDGKENTIYVYPPGLLNKHRDNTLYDKLLSG